MTEEEKQKLEFYKFRYTELRKEWDKLVNIILGEDYYNYGCDTYSCDRLTAEDILYKFNHTTAISRLYNKIKKYIKHKIGEW